ncbi:pilus assembly protein N-terminal domain-containing protein [Prosthecochloris sp. N3]|uniref:Pilus assembly protein N-terminal domain-containing protein n=1 Tax=Prosthecochloris ethylica TaxID=2743976 RepID=A0ABR9XPN0_9CHLB|nr:pilus assembly protein N-terminal domain-containing protein [Prosthecochloris ethylica]MBF0586282.1 pilus assembly protein N-terminal domain-containing protein [Prosthecochloris ethylica]MBF0635988.1 pilus assembly protein N-terminal domain-containing protein [Prosthecochloris ethylica]NUK47337.1 pilus assembly protein N-terminal domain-containing protein [Prosthecochloris ethylica]
MNVTSLLHLLCRTSILVTLLVGGVSRAVIAAPPSYLVPAGESRVYRLDRPIERVAVGDPSVADYIILNPTELYLLGKKPGATNLIIWDKQGSFISRPLQVSRNITHIRDMLKAILPDEKDIRLFAWGQALVLSGTVSDELAAETVYRLVKAYLGGKVPAVNPEYTLINRRPASAAAANITGKVKSSPDSGSEEPASLRGVVNLLTVRDPQQVRLEVRIAEVSRSCMQAFGLGWTDRMGNMQGSIMAGFVSNATLNVLFDTGGALNVLGQSVSDKVGNQLDLESECKKGLIKILAEPTIVTMSGQEGYFLVGGKLYTPTISTNGAVDYVERTYGVGLRFIPTVLDSGRISLKVAPEVSEPLKEAITAGTTSSLPAFKTTYASTTVQMSEGQNLVIGGLLRDNLEETIRAVPLLSKIPILGALFRRTEKSSESTELMVVVRPTLVKASDTMPELPTDRIVPPTHKELFIDGKLQGSRRNR